MASLKDIAKLADVSVCTVSRYLNHNISIKKETEEKILQAIRELEYVPNEVAKSLKRNVTPNVAVILPKIDNLYYATMTAGISEVLRNQHYNLFIYEESNLNLSEKEILQSMRENMVAGVIFIGLSYDYSFRESAQLLLDWKIPVVYMNRQIEYIGYPLVYPDFMKAGRLAAGHFREKGRRKTAFAFRNKSFEFMQSNIDAYMDSYPNSDPPVLINLDETENLDQCVDQIRAERVDSVFVLSELLAIQLTKRMLQKGIGVPDDVAVIGFGNSLMSEICNPSLTCLDFDDKEMGRRSAELILNQIKKQTFEPVTVLPVRLIERDST